MPNKSKVSKKKKNVFLSPAVLIAMALIVAVVIGLTIAIVQLNNVEEEPNDTSSNTTSGSSGETLKGTYYAELEMEDGGKIVMELYADIAPITVTNFVKLVQEKFYDGLTFHRVDEGFMIQGGDPKGDGTGGSAETIFGEFAANGFENNLSHTRGVISMARRSYPLDSASSQFFICHGDSTFLDGQYAAFGKVISGMDVVDRIASVPVKGETPLEKVVIKTIRMIDKPAA
jgi:cyclophilin family peptidyl-prolyl cis-trans isomerase